MISYPDGHEADDGFPMRNGILTLTEREKETLRLLVGGHDAKSIARQLGLSVHTINERLRDARRKLDVSSSREAARLLAEAEQRAPDYPTDKLLGVPEEADDAHPFEQASGRQSATNRLAWFGGGMLIMSLLIVVVALSSVLYGNAPSEAQRSVPTATAANASASASLDSARKWLALLDRQSWEESWRTATTLFKSQISASQWTSTIQSVRQPLGKMASRTFLNVTKTNSLPGAPAGEYEVIQFQTSFAGKRSVVETITLARDRSGWRVAGYFIR
ncbi:DUF4019 domain-containing protein [uncultured Sphingomonas sp.]|uniref:helix-turn-helix domain-containing protein n=1 Tax=uncultured Sphingomonas sp. TaxID=158754 RepID=UPI0035CA81F8